MAYYAALLSLRQTIYRFLESSQVSIHSPCRETMEAYVEVTSLSIDLEELEKQDRMFQKNSTNDDVQVLMGEIRDGAYKLEDSLVSHFSDQFLSNSESFPVILSPDLEEIKEGVNYLKETLKKLITLMKELITNPLPEQENDYVSQRLHFGGHKSKMVGFSTFFEFINNMLTKEGADGDVWKNPLPNLPTRERADANVWQIVLTGMAGIGKSRLAKEIYESHLDFHHFDCCAWVTIGPENPAKTVLVHDKLHKEGNEILVEDLYSTLKDKRYLIVIDDVWSKLDVDKIRDLLPKEGNQSMILGTSRMHNKSPKKSYNIRMQFLSEEESWVLFRQQVFGEELFCPFELREAGKKIAKKCEGLPLTILTVANILSKSEKTPKYWKKVAKEQYSSVFTDAYEQMSKILFPSYKYLTQFLKAAFLYMGVFPPSTKICASKIFRLWIAEGLIKIKGCRSGFIGRCLDYLVTSSVVLRNEYKINSDTKTCSLNSAFWYLCTKEARKDKFFHILRTYPYSFIEYAEIRRFAVFNNVLFGMKEVHELMKTATSVHSLLCTGPEHQYPVPLFTNLRLLRVLDALTLCYYNFPVEVLKFVHLRYLALTCSRNIPTSISNLWNLECLIVRRILSINKSSGDQSCIPSEIWDMQNLLHLQVTGSNLPKPCDGSLLQTLLSLSDLSVNSCTKEILEKIPNLKRLGVQIELEPRLDIEPKCCFDHLYVLERLETLKCVVVNPNPNRYHIVAPPTNTSFPSTLSKLSLSGFGYPWECMRVIAQLPNLMILKLRCYAFRGPEWVIHDGEFKKLDSLMLEDIDLVHWKLGDNACFPRLVQVTIKHCYKLKEIPSSYPCIDYGFVKFVIIDCPLILDFIIQLVKENRFLKFDWKSSWDDAEYTIAKDLLDSAMASSPDDEEESRSENSMKLSSQGGGMGRFDIAQADASSLGYSAIAVGAALIAGLSVYVFLRRARQ